MLEKSFAALVLIVCAALLLRLVIGERLRWKFDSALRRGWARTRAAGVSLYRWRDGRRSRKSAERLAEEAIRRARGEGHWEGNVFKPKSFKRPPRDKMH
ncbi:MAG: hypothetical protein KF891_02950 [Rhizobacter sp.]|nr:hypothetical protein [Rhizobacter sp.]